MHFRTQSDWAVNDPLYAVFDDPEKPSLRWRAVELPLVVYYYHVCVAIDYGKESETRFDLIIGELKDALRTLAAHPGSTLALQTPEWANNGDPGLFRVNAIYKASTPQDRFHVAECANGKVFKLTLNSDNNDIDIATIKKDLVWPTPQIDS